MILGVSHIVLGSTNLAGDRRLFERLGWTTQFEQRHIQTAPGKRPFMKTASAEQGLLFLQPPTGTPVELIHYADAVAELSTSPLQIVLPEPQDLEGFERVNAATVGLGVTAYAAPQLTCPLWFSASAPVPSVLVHFVSDVGAAARFWTEGVGFKAVGGPSRDAATLEFRSIVPQWRATLELIRAPARVTDGSLDAAGFRCLSVVASDATRAVAALRASGAGDSTGAIYLVINGKPLSLELLRGPDGVFVEVLEAVSRREGRH